MAILKIRASSLDAYNSCNRMGIAQSYPDLLKQRGYEVKKPKRWVKTSIGTGVHGGAEYLHKHILENKTPITDDVIAAACEAAFTAYKKDILYNLERNEEVNYSAKFNNIDVIREHMNDSVHLYATKVLPNRTIESYEEQFTMPIEDGFEVGGKFDSLGQKTLYDLKTGEKRPAHAQVGTYTLLLRNAGYEIISAQLDYISRPREGSPIEHKVVTYDPDECMVLAQYTIIKLMIDLKAFQETGDINVITYNPRSADCGIFCPLFGTTSCNGWSDK